MDALVIAVFLFVIGVAAQLDYKNRRVPDALAALLWIIVILFAPSTTFLLSTAFTAVFMLNTLHTQIMKRPLLSWGDVLYIPPFLAFIDGAFHHLGFLIATLFVALGIISSSIHIKESKGEPLVAWMFLGAVFICVVWIVGSVVWK